MNTERYFVITPIGHVEAKTEDQLSFADMAAAAVLDEAQARAVLARLKELLEPALTPCRSPYCECSAGQCTHPGCYDARGT